MFLDVFSKTYRWTDAFKIDMSPLVGKLASKNNTFSQTGVIEITIYHDQVLHMKGRNIVSFIYKCICVLKKKIFFHFIEETVLSIII